MAQKILVVDDSQTVVKFVGFSLRNSGFEVIVATDGMDALEKISTITEGIDLIITDLNMPNLDGYGFIETLRQNEAFNKVPIIILSSEEEQHDIRRGLDAGATAYLLKPFKPQILLDEVAKHVNVKIDQTASKE